MRLDPVHDIQRAYRSLVTATSFPGTIVDVSEEAAGIDLDSPLPRPLLLLAIMLLDAEVTFSLSSADAAGDAAMIARLTYARSAAASEAAFVFAAAEGTAPPAELVRTARRGTLVDPHLGATILVQVAGLEAKAGPPHGERHSRGGDAGVEHAGGADAVEADLLMRGPGVDGERGLTVCAAGFHELLAAREEANREYPLGVDLVLFTASGMLASIPRTTQVAQREAPWAT